MAPSKNARKARFKQQQQEAASRSKETSVMDSTADCLSCKGDQVQHEKDTSSSSSSCSSSNSISCSTPKAQRFRIPECLSCPPAPMKKRVSSSSKFSSSMRSPITKFFASPDIELFFFFALNNNVTSA